MSAVLVNPLSAPLPLQDRPAAPLPGPSDWSFELIEQYHKVIRDTAARFGLDTYPNQLEIITAEQMMDAYASVGMPVNYRHWSYGKEFIATEKNYKRGHMGLAYEIVINSNPCISYLMEENTMAMQALVIAHAAYGHNSFFKGNYLFRMWTDAASIIDYLVYAKNYVAGCEERHTCRHCFDGADRVGHDRFASKSRRVDHFDRKHTERCSRYADEDVGAQSGRALPPFAFESDRRSQDRREQESRGDHRKAEKRWMSELFRECAHRQREVYLNSGSAFSASLVAPGSTTLPPAVRSWS